MRWPIIKLIIGAILAFSSTFAGVYVAFCLERSEREAEKKAQFVATMRVALQDCDLTRNLQILYPQPTLFITTTLMSEAIQSNVIALDTTKREAVRVLIWKLHIELAKLKTIENQYNVIFFGTLLGSPSQAEKAEMEKQLRERKMEYQEIQKGICAILKNILHEADI